MKTHWFWKQYAGNLWFWCPQISENHEMSDVGAFPAPPQPKTMQETKYLDPKSSHEKNFFAENVFSQYFHFFRHLNISIFAILPIWGCVRPYNRDLNTNWTSSAPRHSAKKDASYFFRREIDLLKPLLGVTVIPASSVWTWLVLCMAPELMALAQVTREISGRADTPILFSGFVNESVK